MEKIKVLIADDYPIIRESLKAAFDIFPEIQVAGMAKDGKEAIKKVKLKRPDVVLMDIQMPQMDGIQAAKIINEKYPEVAIIFLTIHKETISLEDIKKIKAHGLIYKEAGINEIYKRIKEAYKTLPRKAPVS